MIKRITESNFYGKEEFFLNEETGDAYSRIVGGLGWPWGDRPGFAIVLAESRFKDRKLKKPHYYVLAEHETFNPTDLLMKCVIFQREYSVSQFYGDTGNEPMMEFLRKLNIGLYLTAPPFIDDPNALNAYVGHIRECTIPGKKRLHFGSGSLGARLLEIPGEKIRRATKAQDFPMLAALGGALSALIVWVHDPDEQRRVDVLNEEIAELHGD